MYHSLIKGVLFKDARQELMKTFRLLYSNLIFPQLPLSMLAHTVKMFPSTPEMTANRVITPRSHCDKGITYTLNILFPSNHNIHKSISYGSFKLPCNVKLEVTFIHFCRYCCIYFWRRFSRYVQFCYNFSEIANKCNKKSLYHSRKYDEIDYI